MRLLHQAAAAISAFAIAGFIIGCASTDDINPTIYDPHADGGKQLAESLQQAKAENKRVLIDLGANWCGDSQAMFRVLSTNREIQRFISDRYVNSPGSNVKAVSGPPASRPWAIVTIGKPAPDVQKLADFLLSPEGQKLLQK